MSVRTSSTKRAVTSCERWADGCSGYQGMTVGTAEEWGEREGRRAFERLRGEDQFGSCGHPFQQY